MRRRAFLGLGLGLALPGRVRGGAFWQGRGLGGAVSVRLEGRPETLALLVPRIRSVLARVESLASLHGPSELVRLNALGRLSWPSADLQALLHLAGQVHRATGGAFDPTVQPLWQALARNEDPGPARALIGFDRVRLSPQEVRLGPGQALTLNGIAQGWAADRVAEVLTGHQALIDMGEFRALGLWPVTVAGRPLALRRALAVSEPMARALGSGGHILGPRGQAPLWQRVVVTAPSAVLADALSTGFCLMEAAKIAAALAAFPGCTADYA